MAARGHGWRSKFDGSNLGVERRADWHVYIWLLWSGFSVCSPLFHQITRHTSHCEYRGITQSKHRTGTQSIPRFDRSCAPRDRSIWRRPHVTRWATSDLLKTSSSQHLLTQANDFQPPRGLEANILVNYSKTCSLCDVKAARDESEKWTARLDSLG